MAPKGNKKNEKLLDEETLAKMPGDMKKALAYPEIDPTTMNSPEKYEKYRANVKEMLKDGLSQVEHQKEIKIPFANFDNILANMKLSAVKKSGEYNLTNEGTAKQQMITKINDSMRHEISEEAAEKAMERYIAATVEPFMDTAFGEVEKGNFRVGINGRHWRTGRGNESHQDELPTMRAKMVLVNGKSVEQHFQENNLNYDKKNSAEYNKAVNTFVGLALQNGYKVEAVIPQPELSENLISTFSVSAKRVELKAEGCKMPEMKFLPVRIWDKFCGLFGIQTERQKHNENVLQYYRNLEETKKNMEKELNIDRDPEIDQKDFEEAGMANYEKQQEEKGEITAVEEDVKEEDITF